MEGLNKFKVITVLILCAFVFVIAAIYSNTKEITKQRSEQDSSTVTEEHINDNLKSGQDTSDITVQIDRINARLDELSQRMSEGGSSNGSSSSSSSNLNCRVYGVENNQQVESMDSQAAIEAAKSNNARLVLTCSL